MMQIVCLAPQNGYCLPSSLGCLICYFLFFFLYLVLFFFLLGTLAFRELPTIIYWGPLLLVSIILLPDDEIVPLTNTSVYYSVDWPQSSWILVSWQLQIVGCNIPKMAVRSVVSEHWKRAHRFLITSYIRKSVTWPLFPPTRLTVYSMVYCLPMSEGNRGDWYWYQLIRRERETYRL